MQNEKLLPCPFCDGEAKLKTKSEPYFSIGCECTKCYAKTPYYCPNLESENALDSIEQSKCLAIEKWNTRKPIKWIVKQLEAEKVSNVEQTRAFIWNSAIQKAIECINNGEKELE